jgi:hypothetical protein
MFVNIAAAVLAVFAVLRLKDLADGKQTEKATNSSGTTGAVTPVLNDANAVKSPVVSDAVLNKQVIPVDVTTDQLTALVSSGVKSPSTALYSSNLLVTTATAQRLV